ncbi:MAG: MoxR family ATPase [Nitrospirae bacterium]|nr:MoxR family ATPase [Nitrospirota bacterium]
MFDSVDDVSRRLLQAGYVADSKIATSVYLAVRMEKPLLVEGPSGVGKTELAKCLAGVLGCEMVRLQCYEGLDESKALYEWEYSKQLLYTQILRDRLRDHLNQAPTLKEAVKLLTREDELFFSRDFLQPRPLLKAILSPKKTVLLIDEIDRAEAEFEAFLLEILSDMQVSLPEIGTVKAVHIPLVVLTNNRQRDLSDALRRRCLHLFIQYPEKERELNIVRTRVPELPDHLAGRLVETVQRIRRMDLKKMPGVSETLDWAKVFVLMSARDLEPAMVRDTLNVLLKYEQDIRKVHMRVEELLTETGPAAPAPGSQVGRTTLN